MTPATAKRYLLISPIEYHQDAQGTIWLDPLWGRDLQRHFPYIADLIVAAPRLEKDPPSDWVRVEPPLESRLTFVPLPRPASAKQALLQLPRTVAAVLRAVRNSDVVHSGMAGWPYPLGAIANPLAVWCGKPLIVVVESSFWRLSEGTEPSVKARFRALLTEALARWSVRKAALSVFTTTAYRDSLARSATGALLVTPASWIAEEDAIGDAEAEASWAAKTGELSLAFAGRLTVEKGVEVLLQAIRRLDERGVGVRIDIIGEGPLRQECERVAATLGKVRSQVFPPLPYGPEFRRFLRQRHAVIVPSISEEQPRIIFDAYSQGVPVIASDTEGHRECVRRGETGLLFAKNDPEALANCVEALASRPGDLRELGKRGLRMARGYTHHEMHRLRAQALRELLGERGAGEAR